MKAIGLYHYVDTQSAECLVEQDIEKPTASGFDCLIKVEAISVNPVDTKVRSPKEKIETSLRVLGWDAAGEVVSVGEKCTRLNVGDRVFYAGSITRPGSNSEYQLVDERIVGHKPTSLDYANAAALPLTSLTAWESLYERMDISEKPSDKNASSSLLIIGGAGGVGSIATQLAKKLSGVGSVIATASRSSTEDWCHNMGADYVINHRKPLAEQLKKIGFEHVDYILCCSSTDEYFDQMVDIIKPQGSICTIVETAKSAPLPMNKLQGKSVRFCWEFMFTRSMYTTEDIHIQADILNTIARLMDEQVLTSTMTQNLGVINAKNMIEAHRQLESGSTIGKLVLSGF